MSTSREQRQRQELEAKLARDELDKKGKEELQKLEEGQEISPDLAGHLQPQLGNAALNNLLNRSAPAQSTSSAGAMQTEEVGEESVEAQEEEELKGEELEAPLYGGGASPPEEAPPGVRFCLHHAETTGLPGPAVSVLSPAWWPQSGATPRGGG